MLVTLLLKIVSSDGERMYGRERTHSLTLLLKLVIVSSDGRRTGKGKIAQQGELINSPRKIASNAKLISYWLRAQKIRFQFFSTASDSIEFFFLY